MSKGRCGKTQARGIGDWSDASENPVRRSRTQPLKPGIPRKEDQRQFSNSMKKPVARRAAAPLVTGSSSLFV
jgi:hypothetical protein